MLSQFSRGATWLLATLLALAAGTTFYFSLNHPITADLAMMHYSAWLINEKHFVLYRDIFDINFPAPYLFHSLLGKALGYEALPLRWVDFALMTALGWASWKILSPLSKPAAIFGFSLFCLLYWINGGEFVLERDVLALVPAAIAFAFACDKEHSRIKTIFIGIFSAIACSMKPNTVVIVPALLWILFHSSTNKATTTLLLLTTILLAASVPFIWLISQGGLQGFFEIFYSFLPIYATSSYNLHPYTSEHERWAALLEQYLKFGGLSLLLSAPGLIWTWSIHRHNNILRLRITQLAVISFTFTLYEVIASKFWVNHLFPSAYWSFLCFALLLTLPTEKAAYWQKILAILVLLPCFWLGWHMVKTSLLSMKQAHDVEAYTPKKWRAHQVADYLTSQSLQAEDSVQVLDMAGDGQATLLMAKATSATRFLIDVPLYMEIESRATQNLRQSFLYDLQKKKPTYIVYFEHFFHPGGGNRLKDFKPLYLWVNQHYTICNQEKESYIIFCRK